METMHLCRISVDKNGYHLYLYNDQSGLEIAKHWDHFDIQSIEPASLLTSLAWLMYSCLPVNKDTDIREIREITFYIKGDFFK